MRADFGRGRDSSPAARAELALALWDSLGESDREMAVGLNPEQIAELERRSAEHRADPSTAIPWTDVQRKLAGKQ